MRRLDLVLSRVAERGDPLGADLLIEHLERKLAGEPDLVVVAQQRSGNMQTFEKHTAREPVPPVRRRGLAVAGASFIAVLVAVGGILVWNAIDDSGGRIAAPATGTIEPMGTFSFDGTTWSYDGPSTVEAGPVTFALVNTSDVEVGLVSWFGLEGEELAAELEIAPLGTYMGPMSGAPPPPPSDLLWPLVEAPPGESTSATMILGAGSHLIDARSLPEGDAGDLWRVALIEVVQPASLAAGEPVGTFRFDGATWSYDGPSTVEAGPVTFALVNTSDVEVGLVSWFGLEGEELAAELAIASFGTYMGPMSDVPPPPPSDLLWPLVKAAPGESASATMILGAGSHLIDARSLPEGDAGDLWRVALIEVVQP